MAEPRGKFKLVNPVSYQFGGSKEAFYKQRMNQPGKVPEGYEPGTLANNITGSEYGNRSIDMDEVDARRAAVLQGNDALHLSENGPDGKRHDVYVQLEIFSRQVKGGKRQEMVRVRQAVGHNYSDTTEFALDMHDAPIELRQAVIAAHARFANDEHRSDQFSDDQRINRETVSRLGPLVADRLRRDAAAARQTTEAQFQPTSRVVPVDSSDATPDKSKQDRRGAFIRRFGNLPDHVYNATKQDGVFVAALRGNKFAAVKLSPVDNSRSVIAWRIGFVVGEDVGVQQGDEFRAQLSNLPKPLQQALRDTLEIKRSLGETDPILVQAAALREQGRAFGKKFHEGLKYLSDDPQAMRVGDDGYIKWQQLPDGKLRVAAVLHVPGVTEGAVYARGLKGAPRHVRVAARASGLFVQHGDELSDLYSTIPDSEDDEDVQPVNDATTSENGDGYANAAK